MRSRTHKLLRRFFDIFGRNFAKLVAPPSNNNKDYLVHLKAQSMLKKKRCKRYQNRPIKRDSTPVQSMSPSNEQRAGTEKFGLIDGRAVSQQ